VLRAPAVSKRALGVVSGFVGAGGNTIAAILQYIFFTHTAVWINVAVRELATAYVCCVCGSGGTRESCTADA
jgi:hypothetical protein